MFCTTERCLSVDKREKNNKQGPDDVSVRCPCNVHTVTCLKLKELTDLATLKVAIIHQLIHAFSH